MSEFWLWFLRPIAEFLGVIALVSVCLLFLYIAEKLSRRKASKK